MALMKCPECGHDVSDKAEKCPNCGCPVSEMLKPEEPTSETSPESERESDAETEEESEQTAEPDSDPFKLKKSLTTVFIVVFIVTGIFTVISTGLSNGKNNTAPSPIPSSYSSSSSSSGKTSKGTGFSSSEIEAATFALAEKAVKSNLKAPSTAKFCKQSECDFDSLGNNQYQMSGWVDAENGFGAMVRSSWYIVAELDGLKMKLVSVLVG